MFVEYKSWLLLISFGGFSFAFYTYLSILFSYCRYCRLLFLAYAWSLTAGVLSIEDACSQLDPVSTITGAFVPCLHLFYIFMIITFAQSFRFIFYLRWHLISHFDPHPFKFYFSVLGLHKTLIILLLLLSLRRSFVSLVKFTNCP